MARSKPSAHSGNPTREIGRLVVVKAAFDAEAKVWFVEDCDLPGVNAEAASLEQLAQKLPGVVADMLEEQGFEDDVDIPIELIAHTRTRARLRTPA